MNKEFFIWVIFAVVASMYLSQHNANQPRENVIATKQRIEAVKQVIVKRQHSDKVASSANLNSDQES